MNIDLEYLYRDAGNNKIRNHVVFSNSEELSIASLESAMKAHLIDGAYFPSSAGVLPDLKFPRHDESLDHDWLEYFGMESTTEPVSDIEKRDIVDFVSQLIEVLAHYDV